MKTLKTAVPVIAGAIAGAVVALIISHGSTTRMVTEQVVSSGVPVSQTTASNAGLSINDIFKKDSPGVVDIDVTAETKSSSNNNFFSTGPSISEDEGAGVVFDNRGDIITDEHVVANATKVVVHFPNGVSAPAKVLGTDPSTDVAVIKVNVPASELHPITFANSNSAQVGDTVVAIGSPFGLPGTTTAGIVSAVGRAITAPNNYTIPGAIQTDAAINPGNSGGPLLDADGDVLGLNDQIETDSTNAEGEGSSAGVGFATPANADVQVADEIISGKTVEHAYVGVCLVNSTSGGARIANSASNGCTTGPVVSGSPAAKAGLAPGETIIKVNGKTVTDSDDFIAVISKLQPGDTATFTIRESNGSVKNVKVKLTNRPQSAPTAG